MQHRASADPALAVYFVDQAVKVIGCRKVVAEHLMELGVQVDQHRDSACHHLAPPPGNPASLLATRSAPPWTARSQGVRFCRSGATRTPGLGPLYSRSLRSGTWSWACPIRVPRWTTATGRCSTSASPRLISTSGT